MARTSGSSANKLHRVQRRRSDPPAFSAAGLWRRESTGVGPGGLGTGISGASSCTGVSLRSASAIAPLSRCIGGALGNRLAQILFDGAEFADHALDAVGFDAGKRRRHQVLAEIAEFFEEWPCRRREKQSLGAAVDRVGAPLDQAALRQLVEQAGQRNRLQVQNLGQLGLFQAFGSVEPYQHHPLSPRDAKLRSPVVRVGSQHASYVIECKGEFSIERTRQHGALRSYGTLFRARVI